jgi:hypothetical protein
VTPGPVLSSSLLVALGLCVGCFVGCGSGSVGSATGTAGVGGASAGISGAAGDPAATGGAGAATAAGPAGSTAGDTGAAGASSGGSGGVPTMGAAGQTAAPDAGAAGAGGAGGAAGAPATSCAGRLVCDDFEKSIVGAKPGAPWVMRTSSTAKVATGTIAVDDTRAFSGKHSVKLSITATATTDTYREAYLAVTGAPLIPVPSNHLYGRFMLYTDRIPDKSVHWTIAHGDGPVPGGTGTYNYGGMGGLMANYYRSYTDNSPAADCWQTKNSPFPTGRWVCVGFEYDGGANEMRFSLDGTEVPELHVVGLTKTDATCTVKGVDGRWVAPTFKNISVGWESYQHDVAGAHDAWIDDVVLDAQPIGCP